jgi:hypothetical protein
MSYYVGINLHSDNNFKGIICKKALHSEDSRYRYFQSMSDFFCRL